MKTIFLFLVLITSAYSATTVSITSDINNVFQYNHKSLGEFIKMYGSPTSRVVKLIKQCDVLTETTFKTPKVVYEYDQFTYMGQGGIIIRIDVTEDQMLGDHIINDIAIYINGRWHRHGYK